MRNFKKYFILTIATIVVLLLNVSVTSIPSDRVREKPVMVEEWMTKPFVENFIEEPLEVEDWMLKPFDVK